MFVHTANFLNRALNVIDLTGACERSQSRPEVLWGPEQNHFLVCHSFFFNT